MPKQTNAAENQKTNVDKSAMDAVIKGLEKSANGQNVTTSSKIRALHAQGFEKGDIARFLGKRYQHVRNVLITPLKKQTEVQK